MEYQETIATKTIKMFLRQINRALVNPDFSQLELEHALTQFDNFCVEYGVNETCGTKKVESLSFQEKTEVKQ